MSQKEIKSAIIKLHGTHWTLKYTQTGAYTIRLESFSHSSKKEIYAYPLTYTFLPIEKGIGENKITTHVEFYLPVNFNHEENPNGVSGGFARVVKVENPSNLLDIL